MALGIAAQELGTSQAFPLFPVTGENTPAAQGWLWGPHSPGLAAFSRRFLQTVQAPARPRGQKKTPLAGVRQ
jgi:hypothetical protein